MRYIEIIEKIASIIDDRKGQLLKQALSSTNNVYGVATQEGVHFLQQSAVAVATRAGIRGALMEFVTRTEAAAAAGVSAAIAAPIAVGVQAACSGVEVNFEANAVKVWKSN